MHSSQVLTGATCLLETNLASSVKPTNTTVVAWGWPYTLGEFNLGYSNRHTDHCIHIILSRP